MAHLVWFGAAILATWVAHKMSLLSFLATNQVARWYRADAELEKTHMAEALVLDFHESRRGEKAHDGRASYR